MLSGLSIADLGIFIVTLLISLSVHEAMHAFTAHRLGDNTASDEGRLTLNPLKHVDLFTTILLPVGMLIVGLPPILIAKPVPFDPHQVRFGEYGSALVALAGPLSNLGLAALGALAYRAGIVDVSMVHALGVFMSVNIMLFVFNMLPLPPLDGSRLFYAFAPEPVQKVMYAIESMGFIPLILILLILSPVLSPVLSNIREAIFTFLI
ncbi:MAG: site-2 protease family protein [Candidatus Saccharimonadales bacterium]